MGYNWFKRYGICICKLSYYGDIGDVLYDTFTSNPYKLPNKPLSTLSEINMKYLNPDGTGRF